MASFGSLSSLYYLDLVGNTDGLRPRGPFISVSPLSVKKIVTSRSPLGWLNVIQTIPYELRLSTQLRIGGLGFKAASRPLRCAKHGIRARRLLVMRFFSMCDSLELSLIAALGRVIPSPRGSPFRSF